MGRRALSLIAALVASFALAVPALSDTRVIVYPNQTPTSTEQNSNAQFARIPVGSFERDALGQGGGINATTGTYANLTCAPSTGLFATVAPASSTLGAGTIYQMGQNDPNPLPTGGFSPALSPSTTNILISGQQTATTSPIGPMTAPGAGNSVYYLIESQLQSTDGNSQSLVFVSDKGVKTFQSVNTNRVDAIVYQLKAGTAASTPTKPTTDSGWLPVCYTLVPNGKTQILTGDITMSPPFTGFVQSANVVHVSPASSPMPDAGNAAVSGQMAANQLVSTASTGTAPLQVTSTTQVANLNVATAGTLTPFPTPTAAAPLIQNGTWPNLTYSCPACASSATAPITLTSGVVALTTPLALAFGGTGTASPSILAGLNIAITGTFPAQTVGITGQIPVANGGTGTSTPSLIGGTNIAVTGSFPAQTLAITGQVAVANGGTGSSSPSLIGGSNIAVTGSFPGQTVALTGQVPVINGGTGTTSPSLIAGTNIGVTGSFPNQTVAFSGVLPIANGGSGSASPTGLSSGNANGAVSGSFPSQTFTVSTTPTFSSVTTGALTTTGTVTIGSGTGCLQVASGVVSTLSCSGGGGISSVSGTSPIVSSGGSTPAISCSTCVVLNPGSTQTGAVAISSTLTSSATVLTGATLPASSTTYVANDNSGTGGTILNVPFGSTGGWQFTQNGVNKATLSSGGGATFISVTDSSLTPSTCVAAGTAGLLVSAGGACAAVGSNKTALAFERFLSGPLTVSTTAAFPIPSGATGVTTVNDQFQCLTAGSGTSTVKWQYTTTTDPTTASWTDITGSSFSWTTAGGAFNGSAFAVGLTGLSATWVRANVTAVGGTAPQNCYFYLHATQTIE